jgi:hypothetical protein
MMVSGEKRQKNQNETPLFRVKGRKTALPEASDRVYFPGPEFVAEVARLQDNNRSIPELWRVRLPGCSPQGKP